mmetsp:Transcript_24794/g.27590  ORF Transcript_24794/g.27590 Transcript_24794/m.27590 type:complete len:382 (+) Transcript_24794:1060-2205(+)
MAQGPLINLKAFKKQANDRLAKGVGEVDQWMKEALQTSSVDINVEKLVYLPPTDLINSKIDEQLAKDNSFFKNPKTDSAMFIQLAPIITIKEIHQRTKQCKLHSVQQALVPSKDKKEVNYVSTHKPQGLPFKPIAKDDLVISVAIYHPASSHKVQEHLVLGSTLLSELKDKIYCLSEHILKPHLSNGGFFFIEGTFYLDMREPDKPDDISDSEDSEDEIDDHGVRPSRKPLDYSELIIKWMKLHNSEENMRDYGVRDVSEIKKKMIDKVQFLDLKFHVNKKYVYMHQGNCQHYMIFTEVRLFNDTDEQNANLYPIKIFQSKVRRRKCMVCKKLGARYVTYRDKLANTNQCFFCAQCYEQLHYDMDGNLLYEDFEVFPYYHE